MNTSQHSIELKLGMQEQAKLRNFKIDRISWKLHLLALALVFHSNDL